MQGSNRQHIYMVRFFDVYSFALKNNVHCLGWFLKNDFLNIYLASEIQNDRISLHSTGGLFHGPFIPACIVSPRTLQSHHSLEALALNFSILVAQNMKTFA